jgi:hypothetical protein
VSKTRARTRYGSTLHITALSTALIPRSRQDEALKRGAVDALATTLRAALQTTSAFQSAQSVPHTHGEDGLGAYRHEVEVRVACSSSECHRSVEIWRQYLVGKSLYATSALIRSNEGTQRAFHAAGGADLLAAAMSPPPGTAATGARKALTLVRVCAAQLRAVRVRADRRAVSLRR